jgi:hypothetical protein
MDFELEQMLASNYQKSNSFKMGRLINLTIVVAIASSCHGSAQKEKLFQSLYHGSFKTRPGAEFEFVDSTNCTISYGTDSARKKTCKWKVTNAPSGTFLQSIPHQ